MAEQILSQDEVEALLSAIKNEDVQTGTKGAPGETGASSERLKADAEPVDLTNADRTATVRMPSLEIFNERTGMTFGQALESTIRRPVRVHHDGTGPMKMSEFLNYLPVPSCLNLVRIEPLWGVSLLAVEARLLYAMLEGFFGGHGAGQLRTEAHTFTSIELTFVRRVVELYGEILGKTWASFLPLDLSYIRTESNPQYASIVQANDLVMVTTYNLELPSVRGKLHLAIPFSSLEPYKKELGAELQVQADDRQNDWAQALQEQLGEFVIDASVELGRAEMTVREMLALETGSVLMLDRPAEEPLILSVEGQPKFFGRPVLHRKHVGFMVGSAVTEEEESGVGEEPRGD